MGNAFTTETIKVIVADDHPVFRDGMAGALGRMKPISKISMAANGMEVLSLLEHDNHDLVLMDIGMKPMDGIETTDIIRKRFPHVKVIALSMSDDVRSVTRMFEKGASGYLLKNADTEEIEAAIRAVMKGEQYFSKEVSGILLNHVNNLKQSKASAEVSNYHKQRLREIIFLICHELTTAEIARALSLSERTIDDYRVEILKTTFSRNSAGIVKYAIANGIDQDAELKYKFGKVLEKGK